MTATRQPARCHSPQRRRTRESTCPARPWTRSFRKKASRTAGSWRFIVSSILVVYAETNCQCWSWSKRKLWSLFTVIAVIAHVFINLRHFSFTIWRYWCLMYGGLLTVMGGFWNIQFQCRMRSAGWWWWWLLTRQKYEMNLLTRYSFVLEVAGSKLDWNTNGSEVLWVHSTLPVKSEILPQNGPRLLASASFLVLHWLSSKYWLCWCVLIMSLNKIQINKWEQTAVEIVWSFPDFTSVP